MNYKLESSFQAFRHFFTTLRQLNHSIRRGVAEGDCSAGQPENDSWSPGWIQDTLDHGVAQIANAFHHGSNPDFPVLQINFKTSKSQCVVDPVDGMQHRANARPRRSIPCPGRQWGSSCSHQSKRLCLHASEFFSETASRDPRGCDRKGRQSTLSRQGGGPKSGDRINCAGHCQWLHWLDSTRADLELPSMHAAFI